MTKTPQNSSNELLTCMGKKPLPFMKYKWIFILISIFFMGLSVYELGFKGLNFGVDFLGGHKIIYKFSPDINIESIRKTTQDLQIDSSVDITPFGGDDTQNSFILRAKYIEGKNPVDAINAGFDAAFGKDKYEILSQESVGPKVGADLRRDALISIFWACALILVYVTIRFDVLFAPGAVVALIHDVVISAGFFSFFGKEFNLPILAALLTILGYSVNDTIVIYDRIRENLKALPRGTPLTQVLDISLTETLSRTIVTSLTVFIVVLALFFIGGSVLHDFAFCMIVGVIFGCYSSLFIATPIYLWLTKALPKRGIAAQKQMI